MKYKSLAVLAICCCSTVFVNAHSLEAYNKPVSCSTHYSDPTNKLHNIEIYNYTNQKIIVKYVREKYNENSMMDLWWEGHSRDTTSIEPMGVANEKIFASASSSFEGCNHRCSFIGSSTVKIEFYYFENGKSNKIATFTPYHMKGYGICERSDGDGKRPMPPKYTINASNQEKSGKGYKIKFSALTTTGFNNGYDLFFITRQH